MSLYLAHTPAGRRFDIILIVAIISSLVVLILDSVPAFASEWQKEFNVLEYIFTALFTIEYLLRLYCSPKPSAYAKSFYGVIDLLAILPTYLAFFFPRSKLHWYYSITACDAYLPYFETSSLLTRFKFIGTHACHVTKKDTHFL